MPLLTAGAAFGQAIARANRRYPGKAFGLSVDYNGMPKSLSEALTAEMSIPWTFGTTETFGTAGT
jgi:hypothetical protein